MTKLLAVTFDLDDTLYLERDYVLSGFHAVARWCGAHLDIAEQQTYDELSSLFEEGIRGNTFDRWLQAHNLDTNHYLPLLIQIYREHNPVIQPFSEVPALLVSLHREYHLGLLSDGYIAVQKRKLESLKIARHFDAIIFSDEFGREHWKPSTYPFQIMLEKIKMEAHHVVYIGDNPLKDFVGARQVGIGTIWVRTLRGQYSQLLPPQAEYAADLVIDTLSQLKQALTLLESK